MTCREADHLTFSAATRPPGSELAAHLASCPACQRRHAGLAAGLEHWRRDAAAIVVPPVEREWQALRRARRTAAGGDTLLVRWVAWAAAPLIAAAAFLVLALQPPGRPPASAGTSVARDNPAASSAVFVDAQSGWLVVWANEPGPAVGL